MSCENKLINFVFKKQREYCKNNNVLPRMKCMNVMQCKSQRQKKTQKPKNNGHKGKAMKHKDHVRKTQLV